MKKIFLTFLSILMFVVVLTGCSANEKGFLGPSWDVPLRVPIYNQVEEVKLNDMLADAPEEVNIPESTDELISFNMDLTSDVNLDNYDFGDIINENVTIPDFDFGSGQISLPVIDSNISGGDLVDDTYEITGGISGDDLVGASLDFPSFSSLTFSDPDTNKIDKSINIELTNVSGGDVVINEFEVSFGTRSKTFTDNILPGETKTGEISLDDLTIDSNTSIVTSITTSNITSNGDLSNTGEMYLNVTFPSDTKVSEVTGLTLENSISKEISPDDISFDDSEIPNEVKSIGFKDGSNIEISLGTTGLEEYINYNLGFFNYTDDDNDGYIDIAAKKMDIAGSTAPYLDFGVDLNIPSGATIDYSTDPINVSGGLKNNGIASATIDFDNFDLGSSRSEISQRTVIDKSDMDIPEEIKNIEFNNAKFTLGIDGVEGLTMDLSGVEFKALDSNGDTLQDLKFDLGKVSGDSGEIELMDKSPNILDLLFNENTQKVVVGGSWNLEGEATIDDTESIGFTSMLADIPFSFTLNEDITHQLVPSSVDTFDAEQIDIIEQGVKEAKLVLKDFNNDMGVSINAQIYMATIDGGKEMSDTQLKDALYKEENMFRELSIEQRTNKDKEFGLKGSEVDKFTQDNLYAGVKIIIPGNADANTSYNFKTGDKISISEIFVTMVGKANQYDF